MGREASSSIFQDMEDRRDDTERVVRTISVFASFCSPPPPVQERLWILDKQLDLLKVTLVHPEEEHSFCFIIIPVV